MKLFSIFILLVISSSAYSQISTKWEMIKERRGVEIFSGDIAGSNVVAFRGVSTINASMEKVVSVIYDVSRIKEWMSDLKSSRVLEKKSKFQKIEYNRTSAPWPISDRDFVYSVDFKVDSENKTIDIQIENATHADAPEVPEVVRGELLSSRYFLKSIEDGLKTYIEVEILADPKGSIPKWVVNLFQSAWPLNTITGISKIATEENYQTHPDITEFIKANSK